MLASAVVSLLLGQVENAFSISLAVLIVGTVGFIQEYRTEKSLEALKTGATAVSSCQGRREDLGSFGGGIGGGDVVELAMGDRVPADITLITANDLQVDESILTGENHPVKKQGYNKDTSGIGNNANTSTCNTPT